MHPIIFLLLLQPALQGVDTASVPASTATPNQESSVVSPVNAVAPAPVSAAEEAAVTGLQSDLQRLIRSPGWRGDKWGVLVVSLDRGDTIFSYEPDHQLAPASNMKLYTSAAALYYLGPDFRYSTYLLTEGEVSNGILQGDLVLYGTGDPTLSDRFFATKTTIWDLFADSLAAQGITEIDGDVVGDASYFSDHGAGEGWQESYMSASYAVLPSALTFNDNLVTLHIRPGDQAGWRPSIQLVPGGDGIALVNQAVTVPRGGRTSIVVDRAAYDGPIVVRGQIAIGAQGLWRSIPVADPARYSATVFREALERRGIQVRGGVRAVLDAADSPVTGRSVFAPAFDDKRPLRILAIHQSPPLQEILAVVNKKSHNLFADVVLRTVGRVVTGEGSVAGGAKAVRYLIECETGIESLDLEIFDGSGLSILNRTTPRTTIRLLSYIADSPIWESFWATLPEAGDADGLKRMYRTRAERNLRAKTGTIDHVSALSGYVRAANGERMAFSIMSNNVPSTWRAKRVEDAIGARIAAFSRPGAPVASASTGTAIAPSSASDPAAGAQARKVEASQSTAPQVRDTEYHEIRSGDTLEGIAKRYGTTVAALQQANPGIAPRRLIPGRRILLP